MAHLFPRRRTPVLVALALATGYSVAASAGTGDPIVPFRSGPGSAVLVEVLVNGTGPFPFVVDTGSTHTAVTPGLGARLGLPRVAKTALQTPAGARWTPVVRLDGLQVGPVTMTGVLATELPAGWLETGGVAGVLGLDVLGTRPFAVDYARGELSWPSGPPAPDALSLEPGPLWAVRVSTTGQVVVLDSGTEVAVLFERGQWKGLSYRGGTSAIDSVTSTVTGRQAVLRVANLGNDRIVELPVVVVDGADIDRAHGDGLLPLHLFDRVTFWPQDGRVQLSRRVPQDVSGRPSAVRPDPAQ